MKKILFIYGGFESYGVEMLSSYLKNKNCSVDLFYFSKLFNDSILEIPFLGNYFLKIEIKRLIKMLKCRQYDFLCFSVVSNDFLWAENIASIIKKNKVKSKIIFGGIHPTLVPENVIKSRFVDFVCEGDGEPFFEKIIEKNCNLKNVPNLWFKENNKIIKPQIHLKYKMTQNNLIPDKEIFYNNAPYMKKAGTFQFTRGCLFKCTFCFHSCTNNSFQPDFQYLSPLKAIEQLKKLMEKFKFKEIIFDDDLFIFKKSWSEEFLKLYAKEINIPFMAVIHTSLIDENIIILLRKANCTKVEIAVQTINNEVRSKVLERNETNKSLIRALNIVNNSGIKFNIQHMMGIPGTSIKDEENAAKLYSRFNVGRIYTFFLTYYPNIKITNWVYNEGIISNRKLEKIKNGKVSSYERAGDIDLNELKTYNALRILYSLIPILPGKLIRFFVKTKIYSYFSLGSNLFRGIDFFNVLKNNDLTAKIFISRYFYHCSELFKKKIVYSYFCKNKKIRK